MSDSENKMLPDTPEEESTERTEITVPADAESVQDNSEIPDSPDNT